MYLGPTANAPTVLARALSRVGIHLNCAQRILGYLSRFDIIMFTRAHGVDLMPKLIPDEYLEDAIASGNIHLIDLAVCKYNEMYVCKFAAKYNQRHIITWALDRGYIWGPIHDTIPNLDFLQWISSLGYISSIEHTAAGAIRNNRLDIVQELVNDDITKRSLSAYTVRYGGADTILYVCADLKEFTNSHQFGYIVARGDLDLLIQLESQLRSCGDSTVRSCGDSTVNPYLKPLHLFDAICSRSLEVVKYVYNAFDDWDYSKKYTADALRNNCMDIYEWLLSVGFNAPTEFNSDFIHAPIEMIKDFYYRSASGIHTIKRFASAGRLDVLQWLYDIGDMKIEMHGNTFCTLVFVFKNDRESNILSISISSCNRELIRWIIQLGFKTRAYHVYDAIRYKCSIEIVSWLLDNACINDSNVVELYYYAIQYNRTDVVRLLQSRSIVTTDPITGFYKLIPGQLYLMQVLGVEISPKLYTDSWNIKLLYELGAPITMTTVTYYIDSQRYNELKWLVSRAKFTHAQRHSLVNLAIYIHNVVNFATLMDAGYPLSHRNYASAMSMGKIATEAIERHHARHAALYRKKH